MDHSFDTSEEPYYYLQKTDFEKGQNSKHLLPQQSWTVAVSITLLEENCKFWQQYL